MYFNIPTAVLEMGTPSCLCELYGVGMFHVSGITELFSDYMKLHCALSFVRAFANA